MERLVVKARFNAYSLFMWGFFAVVSVHMLIWPVIQGVVAKYTWKEVPCYVTTRGDSMVFFFDVSGHSFHSRKADFWSNILETPVAATDGFLPGEPNARCYIHETGKGEVKGVVLTPLAAPTSAALISRGTIMFLIALTVILLTRKRTKKGGQVERVSTLATGSGRGSQS